MFDGFGKFVICKDIILEAIFAKDKIREFLSLNNQTFIAETQGADRHIRNLYHIINREAESFSFVISQFRGN